MQRRGRYKQARTSRMVLSVLGIANARQAFLERVHRREFAEKLFARASRQQTCPMMSTLKDYIWEGESL